MSAMVSSTQNVRFKTGWILLLVAAGLMALNHFVMIFALDDATLFIGYTAFSFYSLVVLWIPFRQLERWAWYCTWLLPAGLAIPATLLTDEVSIFYYVTAAICVVGLLLTRQEFFTNRVEPS